MQRVLERMNTFLRLMHEGLTINEQSDRKIDLKREFATEKRVVQQISTKLKTAFPIPQWTLLGSGSVLLTTPAEADQAKAYFGSFREIAYPGLDIDWDAHTDPCRLFGTVKLTQRQQPFTLLLQCFQDRLLIRCISPVGNVYQPHLTDSIQASVARSPAKVGAIPGADDRSYNLTVEGDMLLSQSNAVNLVRVARLLERVTKEADRLEHLHLRGIDEPLATFKSDLSVEMNHGN